jgi:thiamine-phosphate pyrophosphorylase
VKGLPWPVLMFVTAPHPRLTEIVAAGVAGGVNVVQARGRDAEDDLAAVVRAVRHGIGGRGAGLLVNGDVGLARDADGVHLPERGPSVVQARAMLGAAKLIGVSVHSTDAARRAAEEGADYVVAGAIYATASHPGAAPAGVAWLAEVCAAVSVPVVAIGGITPQRAGECLAAGAAGVAILSPLLAAEDPRAVAASYWAALVGELA